MPTNDKVKMKVLASIPPNTQGQIVDLGSGWGNMAMQLAKHLPHCQVTGYETSPIPYYFSKLWLQFHKMQNLNIEKIDFSTISLKDKALVYTYLYPGAMKSLREKFDRELTPGTIVVSNTFAVPGWDPIQVLEVKDIYNTRIYMYIKKNCNIEALDAKPVHQFKNKDENIFHNR